MTDRQYQINMLWQKAFASASNAKHMIGGKINYAAQHPIEFADFIVSKTFGDGATVTDKVRMQAQCIDYKAGIKRMQTHYQKLDNNVFYKLYDNSTTTDKLMQSFVVPLINELANWVPNKFNVGDKVICKGIGYPMFKGNTATVEITYEDNTIGISNANGWCTRLSAKDFELDTPETRKAYGTY